MLYRITFLCNDKESNFFKSLQGFISDFVRSVYEELCSMNSLHNRYIALGDPLGCVYILVEAGCNDLNNQ